MTPPPTELRHVRVDGTTVRIRDPLRRYGLLLAGGFGVGAMLAGLAGVMAGPILSVQVGMGEQVLILTFVVVVIGGVGSIKGAFLGAMLIGLADTFGTVLLPTGAGMVIYAVMAVVLLWRPQGLFGRTT